MLVTKEKLLVKFIILWSPCFETNIFFYILELSELLWKTDTFQRFVYYSFLERSYTITMKFSTSQEVVGLKLGPNHVMTKDVKSGNYCCCI